MDSDTVFVLMKKLQPELRYHSAWPFLIKLTLLFLNLQKVLSYVSLIRDCFDFCWEAKSSLDQVTQFSH